MHAEPVIAHLCSLIFLILLAWLVCVWVRVCTMGTLTPPLPKQKHHAMIATQRGATFTLLNKDDVTAGIPLVCVANDLVCVCVCYSVVLTHFKLLM